jgi:ankyrin repeat protein
MNCRTCKCHCKCNRIDHKHDCCPCVNRDGGGNTPVYVAVDAGHTEVVKILVKIGTADVDARRPPLQWTPLFTAAFNGKVAMTKVLLELKANVALVHEVSDAYVQYWTPTCKLNTCKDYICGALCRSN